MKSIDSIIIKSSIFFLICIVIGLALNNTGIDNSESQLSIEENTDFDCTIDWRDNYSLIQALYDKVQYSDYCNEYFVTTLKEDKYGNYEWVKTYKITGFSEEEYNEMRKYKSFWHYNDDVMFKLGLNNEHLFNSEKISN